MLRDPRFREFAAGVAHPERPERLDAVEHAIEPLADRFTAVAARSATHEELLLAHGADHLAWLRSLEGRAFQIDRDTYSAPRSLEVAQLAAGGLIDVARRVARGEATCGFAAIRPPGHHAETERAMGFCLLNHVVIAARVLQREGLERIAIVDFDVHHGNGTQQAFESERDVLYLSVHQYPFYPGTGDADEMGIGDGLGATLNLPLPAGCGDAEYGPIFDDLVVPALLEFDPELILVSAGFDAHALDPMASMRLSSAAFGAIAARLRAVAEATCGGRWVLSLEGGYDLGALAESVGEVLDVLVAPETPERSFPAPSPGGIEWCRRLREAHATHWSCLSTRSLG